METYTLLGRNYRTFQNGGGVRKGGKEDTCKEENIYKRLRARSIHLGGGGCHS